MNKQSIDKTSLANWTRSKPNYRQFMYTPNSPATLNGDGSVLDEGEHPITHVEFDFESEEYRFFNDRAVVYVCTDDDNELDLEVCLWM